MKTNLILSIVLFVWIGIVSSCKKIEKQPENRSLTENRINGTWNLMHVFGGIAGVNKTYQLGEVTWEFDENEVHVQHLGSASTYYSLPTGTYPYSILEVNGKNYLSINQQEIGEFTLLGQELKIDENSKSEGMGACGFYMELVRE